MSDLNFLPAVSMAEQIRKKKISPVELVDAHLTQIEKLNPKLNAFVHVDAERARRTAEAAEAAVMRKKKLGPLHGVPISIKSSIGVAGLRCESGTRLRAGFVSAQDAPLVARLRAAGAIVLGVTNTPELLMAWETDNLLYGRTNNPWDLERTPGGSSGGEAAAIAAGMSAGRRGQRRRRFDSRARSLQRHLRPEADAGTNSRDRPLSCIRGSICIDRRRRSDGAHRRRFESSLRGDAGPRHRRHLRSSGAVALAQ